MNDLTGTLAVLGKPYSLTKSRLGAITKVYEDRYMCDLSALKELFSAIGEKLSQIPNASKATFSFLISFSDKTHHDGVTSDLQELKNIPIGKQTERIVLNWNLSHTIETEQNEVSITVRISNPINPLIYLQAALSRSANDIDNFEFEEGFTCVTVDGTGRRYADEVFLCVQNWLDARNKPHAFTSIHQTYLKHEWAFDQINVTLFPVLVACAVSIYSYSELTRPAQVALAPLIVVAFLVISKVGGKVAMKMRRWAQKASELTLFQITNGDEDLLTKMAARSKNSLIKFVSSCVVSLVLNVAAGVACWLLTGA